MPDRKLGVVLSLGTAQTIAWGSSYYLPAILAPPIADELQITATHVYAALSGALMVAGLLGPRIGHIIDRMGGRSVLAASNLVFVAGLIALSFARDLWTLGLAWLVLGVGMGAGLYAAAFASLTRLYGHNARSAITGITLIAGFAATVGWPTTAYLDATFGWRTTCLIWAAAHLFVALPLNLLFPRHHAEATQEEPAASSEPSQRKAESRAMALVAYAFAATLFVSMGLSALMPTLMMQLGATPAAAVFAAALAGPAQVLARIAEASLLRKLHPLTTTRIATLMHPLGATAAAVGGAPVMPAFPILHGAGNGVLTIANGTLPLALFGPQGFGRRIGLISLPGRIAGALAPVTLGYAMQEIGAHVLWISAGLSLSAFLALLVLKRPAKEPASG